MNRGSSIMNKLAGKPKMHDEYGNRKWIHSAKSLSENFVVYQGKFLGCTAVTEPRGIDVVTDAIKKIRIAHELKKSEAGKRGSKRQRVEIWISVDFLKVLNAKSKEVITLKPLHRISYCADDQVAKKIFAFIAKEQETKSHNCYVFLADREAAEITVSVGQAFEMAYKRYLEKGKHESKEKEEVDILKKQIETANAENELLKQKLAVQGAHSVPSNGNHMQENNKTILQAADVQQREVPSLLVDWGASDSSNHQNKSFDPFDNYLSQLSGSRVLGHEGMSDNMQDRGPFQSPMLKESSENPFDQQVTNPFDAFFSGSQSLTEKETLSEAYQVSADFVPYPAPASRAGALQGLPPPPTKQSIRAANATKMRGPKNSSSVENGVSGNIPSDPFADTSQIKKDNSLISLEQSLAAGLQFDAFATY